MGPHYTHSTLAPDLLGKLIPPSGLTETDPQYYYYKSVNRLCSFHYNVSGRNANKINEIYPGLVLQSNIYCRDKNFCKGIPFDQITSELVVNFILSLFHKRDPFM